MSELNQWEKLRRPFPPEQIEKLKKFKNGPELDYIGHATITERLLEVDPEWTYDFVRDNDGKPMIDYENGYAFFYITILGVTRLCVGDTGGKPMHGNGVKEMLGDAIRNGAMRSGVGTYLWSKSEEADMKKRNPFWQEVLDSLSTVDEITKQMRDWQMRGMLHDIINAYAETKIAELKNAA